MKAIFRISLIALLLYLVNSSNIKACSCLPSPTDFCSSIASSNSYIAAIKIQSINGNYISVQVIENLGPAIGNSTITILGRKNSSCTDGVSYAEIGDSLVVGLSKQATDTFNISPCGVFALKLSHNKVTGRIQPGISTKNYDDFKFDLYTCGNSAINIFPNPAKSFITVTNLNEDLNYDISIFSPSGELISASSSTFTEISEVNLENLRPGLYTIKIVSPYEVIIKRFIKQ